MTDENNLPFRANLILEKRVGELYAVGHREHPNSLFLIQEEEEDIVFPLVSNDKQLETIDKEKLPTLAVSMVARDCGDPIGLNKQAELDEFAADFTSALRNSTEESTNTPSN